MTWVTKKVQGFHFSCLFSHFLWLIGIHLHWKTFWKKIFFSSSKHEFGAGAAGFSWCTPARYYGTMCFFKGVLQNLIFTSCFSAETLSLPAECVQQALFTGFLTLVAWLQNPLCDFWDAHPDGEQWIYFFPNINLGEFLFQRKTLKSANPAKFRTCASYRECLSTGTFVSSKFCSIVPTFSSCFNRKTTPDQLF